jgi:L-alanine-DL-glutamate epimerase-like enolase superfamily enzyme
MENEFIGPTSLSIEIEKWPLKSPFRTAAHTVLSVDLIRSSLLSGGVVGQGEAAGVFYRNETTTSMIEQLESVRSQIEGGTSRESVQRLLPPGGARNALDCALWDLESKLSGRPTWRIAGLEPPRPLLTTFTCGAQGPEKMASAALAYSGARAIKLKLTGEAIDADRVRAVREVLPDAWLAVDANQGFTLTGLEKLMAALVAMRVSLIEQPFPCGQEQMLEGFQSPIPIAADESVQSLADIQQLVGRFNVVNIKLDKCGGLTEGLAMARAARELGLEAMVGNMLGTSLAMAPAYLVGQLCQVVDLDGPVFLQHDRRNRVQYDDGFIDSPAAVWGYTGE